MIEMNMKPIVISIDHGYSACCKMLRRQQHLLSRQCQKQAMRTSPPRSTSWTAFDGTIA